MDDRELSARLNSIEETLKEIKQFIIEEIQEEEGQETAEEEEGEETTEGKEYLSPEEERDLVRQSQKKGEDIIEKSIIQPKIRPKRKANTE